MVLGFEVRVRFRVGVKELDGICLFKSSQRQKYVCVECVCPGHRVSKIILTEAGAKLIYGYKNNHLHCTVLFHVIKGEL